MRGEANRRFRRPEDPGGRPGRPEDPEGLPRHSEDPDGCTGRPEDIRDQGRPRRPIRFTPIRDLIT